MRTLKTSVLIALVALAALPLFAAKPRVWVSSDMTDKRLPGPGRSGTITDPDDISAMAGFLLFANAFDVRGISISCTSRKEIASAPDQAEWANRYLGAAYSKDVKNLNATLGGYPESIQFIQSSIKGARFNENEEYANLDSFPSVKALLTDLEASQQELFILCWGPTSEAAILVKHCLSARKAHLLKRIRIIAHWTNSYLHNAGEVDKVANCNFDKPACAFIKKQAKVGVVKYYECGAIGQAGIVNGAPAGDDYFQQFRKSHLGTIFLEGKFEHGKVDWSDAATYVVLLGTFGVTLDHLTHDGISSAAIEQRNEAALQASSKKLHEELLRRSDAAGKGQSRNSE